MGNSVQHRHINTANWTPMAIESLFDRGGLQNWREFVSVMKRDTDVARAALHIADGHEDYRSAALARLLIRHFHPALGGAAA